MKKYCYSDNMLEAIRVHATINREPRPSLTLVKLETGETRPYTCACDTLANQPPQCSNKHTDIMQLGPGTYAGIAPDKLERNGGIVAPRSFTK